MTMERNIKYISVLSFCVMMSFWVKAQVKDYSVTPDFDYQDYAQTYKYMIQPKALVGQTLYLENVSDTLIDYFYVGTYWKQVKQSKKSLPDAPKNIEYYYLNRMSKEQLNSLKGAWFVVLDYVADQFAYSRVAQTNQAKRDWKKLQYSFLKLLVGGTQDTVFYNYKNFYNEYHFPFTPMSYYNNNKNGYPVSKYSNDDLNLISYDTSANYAIVPEQLIGQRISLPVVTDATMERLFNGVKLHNYPDDSRKYSFTEYPIAKAKRLEGQSFVVKDVAFDAQSLTDVYLKLVIDGRRDTIYYKYPTKNQRHLFAFVVESFYQKMKQDYKDRDFTIRGDKYPLTAIDLRTKRKLTLRQGEVLKVLDFVVRDGKFQILCRNERGRKFYVQEDYNLGDRLSFEKTLMDDRVEKYRNTFPTYYKAILNKELVSGMTMDMTNLSWGKYVREVFTNFDGSSRHWFYMGNVYIIFKNNVLYRVAMIPKELR